MTENMNLFDRMHEGLVVVSEEDQSLQFASKPAVKLLMEQPVKDNNKSVSRCQSAVQDPISSEHLKKPMFRPLKVSIENVEELKVQDLDVLSSPSSPGMGDNISLGQIVSNMMKQNGQNNFVDKSEFYQVLLHMPTEINCQVDT